jgi:hypothetical protein
MVGLESTVVSITQAGEVTLLPRYFHAILEDCLQTAISVSVASSSLIDRAHASPDNLPAIMPWQAFIYCRAAVADLHSEHRET